RIPRLVGLNTVHRQEFRCLTYSQERTCGPYQGAALVGVRGGLEPGPGVGGDAGVGSGRGVRGLFGGLAFGEVALFAALGFGALLFLAFEFLLTFLEGDAHRPPRDSSSLYSDSEKAGRFQPSSGASRLGPRSNSSLSAYTCGPPQKADPTKTKL